MYVLPESVSIGSQTFSFVRTKRLEFEQLYGETSYTMGTISFGEHTRGEKMPNTLLHELIHVVAEEAQIKQLQNKDDQEQIVSALANGLTRVLWDLGILPREIVLQGEAHAAQEGIIAEHHIAEHQNGTPAWQEALPGNRHSTPLGGEVS